MAVVSVLFGLLASWFGRCSRKRIALGSLGLMVFAHWVLDFITHSMSAVAPGDKGLPLAFGDSALSAKVETNPDILSFGFLPFVRESSADPEYVAIWMTNMHLADVPRHIGGRKCDLQPGGNALLGISSTSSTQTDIQTPLSPSSSPCC
ncbi:MAG TPA: hypothetical protein VEI01_23655 [Terriglobales bacterium]|nr:hypothetical protein [Terriglobales bacterium]